MLSLLKLSFLSTFLAASDDSFVFARPSPAANRRSKDSIPHLNVHRLSLALFNDIEANNSTKFNEDIDKVFFAGAEVTQLQREVAEQEAKEESLDDLDEEDDEMMKASKKLGMGSGMRDDDLRNAAELMRTDKLLSKDKLKSNNNKLINVPSYVRLVLSVKQPGTEMTVFMKAVSMGRKLMVKKVLEVAGGFRKTDLEYHQKKKDMGASASSLQMTLDRKPEILSFLSTPNKLGLKPMEVAAEKAHVEIIELLADFDVEQKTDIFNFMTYSDVDGKLPIHRACEGTKRKHGRALRTFILLGLDPDTSASKSGKTCRAYAEAKDPSNTNNFVLQQLNKWRREKFEREKGMGMTKMDIEYNTAAEELIKKMQFGESVRMKPSNDPDSVPIRPDL